MMQDAGDGVMVGAAEEMKVIEQRVEVVEVAALGVAGVHGAGFSVCLVEIAGEAAEELGHGEVDFAVADAHGRIDEDGGAVRVPHQRSPWSSDGKAGSTRRSPRWASSCSQRRFSSDEK